MAIPIRLGMKRKMFSRGDCFAASVGRTAAPLPFARLRTAAMVRRRRRRRRRWWWWFCCTLSLCFQAHSS
jgi:hypothetical protein